MGFAESLKSLDYQIKVCEERTQQLDQMRLTLENLLKQSAVEANRWRVATVGLGRAIRRQG